MMSKLYSVKLCNAAEYFYESVKAWKNKNWQVKIPSCITQLHAELIVYYMTNQNYQNEFDWLSAGLIRALIIQFTRHACNWMM